MLHGAKIEFLLFLGTFEVDLLAFAWMIAVKSHQFYFFELRDQNKAFVAFLALNKVHFLCELRTFCAYLVLFL